MNMTNFYIEVKHVCGHTQHHEGGTTGGAKGVREMRKYFADRKCSFCRPMCAFCNRTGDRENMHVTDNGAAFCNIWCYQQSVKPTHYCEHNQIAIPGFLAHWLDMSYHNDMCARSELKIGKDAITIWVERDDPADRENPEGPKFMVVFARDGEFGMDERDMLYEGSDTTVAAQWARAAEVVAGTADVYDLPVTTMASKIRELINTPEEN